MLVGDGLPDSLRVISDLLVGEVGTLEDGVSSEGPARSARTLGSDWRSGPRPVDIVSSQHSYMLSIGVVLDVNRGSRGIDWGLDRVNWGRLNRGVILIIRRITIHNPSSSSSSLLGKIGLLLLIKSGMTKMRIKFLLSLVREAIMVKQDSVVHT
jgi:hypothetical protein